MRVQKSGTQEKKGVSRRSLLRMIGTVAGSTAMYNAMTGLGFAQESGYAGPPKLGNVKAGTLHALALTTSERSPLMPEVPPIAESGVPGFSAAIRYGLVAPPGTPRPIIERLISRFAPASTRLTCAPGSPPTAAIRCRRRRRNTPRTSSARTAAGVRSSASSI